ncbi:MAG: response regulator transcription factor [Actinobacteria bacterium]|nr:response regulator transcription factor [Actinomycetota bacterium]
MTRVLVVDDHPVVLRGLAALIDSEPGLTLVATAGTVRQALECSAEPDLAVVDLQFPDGNGIQLGIDLKRRWPEVRVLVLTMSADAHAVVRSVGAGLDGYLLKDADPDEVIAAIHAAARGALVLGRGASDAVVAAASAAPRTDKLAALDARELEILGLLVEGLTTSQVAAQLFLSPKTILNRVSVIIAKLDVPTKADAIALAKAGGLGSA